MRRLFGERRLRSMLPRRAIYRYVFCSTCFTSCFWCLWLFGIPTWFHCNTKLAYCYLIQGWWLALILQTTCILLGIGSLRSWRCVSDVVIIAYIWGWLYIELACQLLIGNVYNHNWRYITNRLVTYEAGCMFFL